VINAFATVTRRISSDGARPLPTAKSDYLLQQVRDCGVKVAARLLAR